MGVLTVKLSDELERKLRVIVARAGGKKGALGKAISNAIEEYVKKKEAK